MDITTWLYGVLAKNIGDKRVGFIDGISKNADIDDVDIRLLVINERK